MRSIKKVVFSLALLISAVSFQWPKCVYAYDFGDYRSVTLTTKAWKVLADGDIEAVLAYTNKCIELYAEQAKKMQGSMQDYATGSNEHVFSYWALNDVATCLFIQGEAYRKASMNDEAKAVYQKIISEYSFGQTWDPKGWFWKPSEAAKEKLAMIESGSILDFGDYTSSTMTTQAWKALGNNDTDGVMAYTNKVIELYADNAKTMQESLTDYPWDEKDKLKEKVFSYWALNDVGTSLFIQGEALRKAGKMKEAKEAYTKLVEQYYYAQCWDPNGWFWKPSEAAQQALDEIGEI